MKTFIIFDMVSRFECATIQARNGKSALRKFSRCLMSAGFREIHQQTNGEWFLSTSYGAYFIAHLA